MLLRKKKRSFSASACYKPERKDVQKARKDRIHAQQRAEAREKRYAMAGGCCERCGKPVVLRPSEARHEREIANINERIPRSLGGSDTDLSNLECTCWDCHLGKGFHDH